VQQVRYSPLAEDIVSKSYPVPAKVPQRVSLDQSLDSGGWPFAYVERFCACQCLLRKRPEHPCAISVLTVQLAVRGPPPFLGHIRFAA
jgi:hypothetical protein